MYNETSPDFWIETYKNSGLEVARQFERKEAIKN